MHTPFPLKAFMDNYIWIIPEEDSFICVDPGDADPVLAYAKDEQKKLSTLLITHHHHDHIGGMERLLEMFPDCKVFSPIDSRIPEAQESDESSFNLGDIHFEVLHTAGHTSTHISYYAPREHWLFCGDTLFSAGCGRVFDGTLEALHASLNLYKSLPDETLVFSAHEYTRKNLEFALTVEPDNEDIRRYLQKIEQQPDVCTLPSTIALEKKINPFLRTQSKTVQAYALNHGANSTDSLEILRILREAKNHF